VNHCLVGPAVVELSEIREIHSHPVALDQCRRLIESLPNALAVAAATTGDAASIVAERADPSIVAIASDRAARINGLVIIDGNVGDHPEAFTRFVSVAPYTRLDRRDGQWRTAFSFTTDHHPGALFRALEPLARHGIDLNLLVSRPIPAKPFSYRFDAVLGGHPLDPEISATLREMRDLTESLRVFGSYRADREGGLVASGGA
jgi:prephenate dehydratase